MAPSIFEIALNIADNPPVTQEDKISFLKSAITGLGEADQAAKVSENLKGLGSTAVKTDEAFDNVNRNFKGFVDQHGKNFPGLADYQKRWASYQARWNKLLTDSRTLASETASNYDEYANTYLAVIKDLETVDQMRKAADDFEELGKSKPVMITADLSKQFSALKSDVEVFRSEFYSYLDKQKVIVDKLAADLQVQIDKLKKEIDALTKTIAVALGVVGVGAWWNLIISAVALTVAAGAAIARADVYKKLRKAEEDLVEANKKQEELKHIKSDFDGLAPDFNLICSSLQIFADIWNEFHHESLQFAEELRKLPDTKYPEEFKLRVELAMKVAEPLIKGLKAYIAEIHS